MAFTAYLPPLNTMQTDLTKNSILVVAHPDDEVLWFSSILDKVDQTVLCFLNVKSQPGWSEGRGISILEHPITNLSCLEIEESEVFDGANWENPNATSFGLEISRAKYSDRLYKNNFRVLLTCLEKKISGHENVITHNPWGEYGHEEHVQLYRAIKTLQKKLQFKLWFSNYCSNKSFNFMLRHISGFSSEYITLKTNKKLGVKLMDLYKKNGCWTWYDNYVWFNEESFMQDNVLGNEASSGHFFPINLLKVEPYSRSKPKRKANRTLINKVVSRIKNISK